MNRLIINKRYCTKRSSFMLSKQCSLLWYCRMMQKPSLFPKNQQHCITRTLQSRNTDVKCFCQSYMETAKHQRARLMIEISLATVPLFIADSAFGSTEQYTDLTTGAKANALQSCSMTLLWRWIINRCPTKKRNGKSDECLVISGHLSCLYRAGRDPGNIIDIYTVVSMMENLPLKRQ